MSNSRNDWDSILEQLPREAEPKPYFISMVDPLPDSVLWMAKRFAIWCKNIGLRTPEKVERSFSGHLVFSWYRRRVYPPWIDVFVGSEIVVKHSDGLYLDLENWRVSYDQG